MRFNTIRYIIWQGIRNIGRNKMFSIASIATMAACIFIFGIFFAVTSNFDSIVKKAEGEVPIVIFFDEDITEMQRQTIKMSLENRDDVVEVKYVSAEEAWETFKDEYFQGNEEAASGFGDDNPLSQSDNFEVYMSSIENQKELVEFAEGLDGVRQVNKSEEAANVLSNINMLIAYVSGAIILILLIVAVFLISNTVSMGVAIRKEEIAIMKYIGAKDSFVKAPFIIEGVLIGMIGASIPLAIIYFVYPKVTEGILIKYPVVASLIQFIDISTLYRALLPVGLALGVGIGFLGSFMTIRKHLRV